MYAARMKDICIFTAPMNRDLLRKLAFEGYGTMVKAVVDLKRQIVTLGGEMHADGEQMLLENGSQQEDLWGFNLYPDRTDDSWVVFDSMINIRPWQNNRSRNVEDPQIQEKIRFFLSTFVLP